MFKRTNYISWDEFFMGVAELASQRSKDPITQVGACIVGTNNIILGIGYNGMPRGCSDDNFSWEKQEKKLYVVHAEANAITNSSTDLNNAVLYCTLFPCNECAKLIIQKGIKKIIYKEKKNGEIFDAAIKMFNSFGVKYAAYKQRLRTTESASR